MQRTLKMEQQGAHGVAPAHISTARACCEGCSLTEVTEGRGHGGEQARAVRAAHSDNGVVWVRVVIYPDAGRLSSCGGDFGRCCVQPGGTPEKPVLLNPAAASCRRRSSSSNPQSIISKSTTGLGMCRSGSWAEGRAESFIAMS